MIAVILTFTLGCLCPFFLMYRLFCLKRRTMTFFSVRSKVDLYPDMIYLILHFPCISHKHKKATEMEVDFVIGHDFIITTHYEHSDALHEFAKSFEVTSMLEKTNIGEHAGYL